MIHSWLVTENHLDTWVRGHDEIAQGVIVELVWLLVAASCPNPKERRFPLGDSIAQPGPDGVLDTALGYEPFVPEGMSFWEIGTGRHPARKATSDYDDLTKKPSTAIPAALRRESSFVFVTPLSGRTGWTQLAQTKWLQKRHQRNEWRDVRVIDGTKLIDWLRQFPAVELWLGDKMGLKVHQIQTPEQRWKELTTIGDPPPLSPGVFLANRDAACDRLNGILDGNSVWLKIDTHFTRHVADFVSAYIATLDDAKRADAAGRCLIVSGEEAWNELTAVGVHHLLVADFALDDADTSGMRLLQKAKNAGHRVIYCGAPGGIPNPNRVSLPNPRSHQVQKALEEAGYSEERARNLAHRTGGDLNLLLRCIQGLSSQPEWAQTTDAAELAIAELLGAWSEESETDRLVVEALSGNSYGEWVGKMRDVVLRPGTPLTQRDGVWKFVARYEGWYALGPRLFDEHLDRLREATVRVLRERDPRFDLPPEERYAASVYGKVLLHSGSLRNGLAETLALLGSHPDALTSCSSGKAEATAVLSVREILADADWVQWASLNDVLPLLAEAAPGEFLSAVENALTAEPCPFDEIFSQEGPSITGANYMTGLLWALETLAWDADYLTRVVIVLGALAQRDPGGTWANRPANSLATILLPWLPQTCAPAAKRKTAIVTLHNEFPDVAWRLLLDLLPTSPQVSLGSRRPAWRETIPDDWTKGATDREHWEQIGLYAELAMEAAKGNLSKLAELVDRLGHLPPLAHERLLAHLGSDSVMSMPQADRLPMWTALVNLVSEHRRYADAEWALKPEQVDRIAAIAERLAPEAPALRHARLFSERDHDLYKERGNYEAQHRELVERRQKAVEEIAAIGGVHSVLAFAASVESPWRVGVAYGSVASGDADGALLPHLLDTEQRSLARFVGGFVSSRFGARGWRWADAIDTSRWTSTQIGQFLAYLPFTSETWARSAQLLAKDESPYWTKTSANPYEADTGLEVAADQLIANGRPGAALGCLNNILHDKQPLDSARAVRALLAALGSSEAAHAGVRYDILDIIKALQDDPGTDPDDLFRVEWAYLPLLEGDPQTFPKLLERRLANDPGFFCEAIRLVFRSSKAEHPTQEPAEQAKNLATNAYRLLSKWRIPPGCREDGSFDGDALAGWLDTVKRECGETGHLEVAMTMVGQALIHTPADPNGLWIHRSAATALNAKDAGDMRDGFCTALLNTRGVYWSTAGREERELADKYRSRAETVEAEGFHCLAGSLRDLARFYERDADRQAAEDAFED